MTSDSLSFLRGLPAQLRASHREYAKKSKAIKDSEFLDDATKRQRLAALATQEHAALAALRSDASTKAAALRESVSKSLPAVTEVAKAQILRALDNGVDWRDIARLCVAQKDRAALAALREQLPWEAAAGKLGDKNYAEQLVKDALGTLDLLERPLFDERELQTREEAREVNACYGAVEENFRTLEKHYLEGQEPQLMGHQQPVKELYNWVGIPDRNQQSNVGATSLKLQVEDAQPTAFDYTHMRAVR